MYDVLLEIMESSEDILQAMRKASTGCIAFPSTLVGWKDEGEYIKFHIITSEPFPEAETEATITQGAGEAEVLMILSLLIEKHIEKMSYQNEAHAKITSPLP